MSYLAGSLKHKIEILQGINTPNIYGGFNISYKRLISLHSWKKPTSEYIKILRAQSTNNQDNSTDEFGVRLDSAISKFRKSFDNSFSDSTDNYSSDGMGKQFDCSFDSSFNSFVDIYPIKSDYFVFLRIDQEAYRGRLYKINKIVRDDNAKEFLILKCTFIEEQGLGAKNDQSSILEYDYTSEKKGTIVQVPWGILEGNINNQKDLIALISSMTINISVPHYLSDLIDDFNHRLVTDAEKTTWNGKQNILGFTPENEANKVIAFQLIPDDTHYPSEKLVKDNLDLKLELKNLKKMMFFGLNPPAWVSGKWYSNYQMVGTYLTTTGPLQQNKLWIVPLIVLKDEFSVDQVGMYCSAIGTLGTGAIDIEIFACNDDGNWPTSRLVARTILTGFNTGSAGMRSATLNYTFNVDRYWIAITSDTDATVTWNNFGPNWGQESMESWANYYYQKDFAYGDIIPDPFYAFSYADCNCATATEIQVGFRKS